MQSIYKPGGADTRETWFSIATFCTFRPFSLFGSDFQLCKLSWNNSEFCFYPALACLNIPATSNISKFLLGISSSRSPRTARLLSSVGDYVPCQKFAPAKTYRLWPGKFVNYPLLLSLIIAKAHPGLCNIIRVITKRILSICDTGRFFNWASPEFAKCWPVNNQFQKNVRVPDWPPLMIKKGLSAEWFSYFEDLEGGQSRAL